MAFDPYDMLDVPRNATDKEIKAAWRRKAQQLHPDRHPDDPYAGTRFQLAKEAFEILSDPARRVTYDQDGKTEKPPDLRAGAMALLVRGLTEVLREIVSLDSLPGSIDSINVIKSLATFIERNEQGAKADHAKQERNLERLRKVQKRFAYKGASENVLANVIENQIVSTAKERDKIKPVIAEFQVARELLAEYEDLPSDEQVRMIQEMGRVRLSHWVSTSAT